MKQQIINEIKHNILLHGETDVYIKLGTCRICGRNKVNYIGKLNKDDVTLYSRCVDNNEITADFNMNYEEIHIEILNEILHTEHSV